MVTEVKFFNVNVEKVVNSSYEIIIGSDLWDNVINDLKNGFISFSKIAVITDSLVKKLYGDMLIEKLRDNNIDCNIFFVDSGEKFKNRESKSLIEDEMLEKGFGRDCAIIALGGGMISDLAGFIASTFCRGIPYINYSTTLLSAADASVGGKTAVNTPVATNLIGTFYQPAKVYIDLNTWCSLPKREFRSGLAETIKHACIADYSFFVYLEENLHKLINANEFTPDSKIYEYIALKNCEIKYTVVEKDEREENLRQILNLGHTAGRALETQSNYRLLHGEAIAVGLVIQARISHKLGYLTKHEMERVCNLLTSVGFDIDIPHYIDSIKLVEKMYTDKKTRKGKIRFVLMDGIGNVKRGSDGSYSIPVSEKLIFENL